METTDGTELYKKHRPKAFKTVVGQEEAIRSLRAFIDADRLPHTIIFTGPSGCGKTTLARICADKLDCHGGDFTELNAADFRGIDTIRDIRTRVTLAPMFGKCRVWVIDEAHALSKDAQNAFLKLLEDTPKHAYFFLCTTDPAKLLKTIITRATEIKIKEMDAKNIEDLLRDVIEQEKLEFTDEVIEKIVSCSLGSGRMALVMLNKIVGIEKEEEQLETIEKSSLQRASIELARLLLKSAPWKDVAKVIREIDDEPETVRRVVNGYMAAVLANGAKNPRAFAVLEEFRDDFYTTLKAGLVRACYALSAR